MLRLSGSTSSARSIHSRARSISPSKRIAAGQEAERGTVARVLLNRASALRRPSSCRPRGASPCRRAPDSRSTSIAQAWKSPSISSTAFSKCRVAASNVAPVQEIASGLLVHLPGIGAEPQRRSPSRRPLRLVAAVPREPLDHRQMRFGDVRVDRQARSSRRRSHRRSRGRNRSAGSTGPSASSAQASA